MPKGTTRNISNKIILLNETLKDFEHTYIERFRVMMGVMMNLKKYAEKYGKKIRVIFVLTDLKRENKENIVFVMRVKTHI